MRRWPATGTDGIAIARGDALARASFGMTAAPNPPATSARTVGNSRHVWARCAVDPVLTGDPVQCPAACGARRTGDPRASSQILDRAGTRRPRRRRDNAVLVVGDRRGGQAAQWARRP